MKKEQNFSEQAKKLMLMFQKDEITSSHIYSYFASKVKNKKDSKILTKIAQDEASHAKVWAQYTKQEVKPNMFKVWLYRVLIYVLGYTFVIKLLEAHEYDGIKALKQLETEIPEVKSIIKDEKAHEKKLVDMLDEERLNYVGAMVLGLNDALVELTGTIAGMTFVLANTTLIAFAGIITGVSATLSMAASNYLAERADGNPNALKASIYTGIAYLITVVCLVLPYLLLPVNMYVTALACMIAVVVFLIFIFNYYIGIVKSEPFLPKFAEMAGISLTVALIAFLIGWGAKVFFNLDIG
ncbi:MAG: VIT1/CCC1 transporter family protein [Alphaproteobacteria bacterium]|nr:VIT1/CCC1 transporter family protein [Alphaproteobacteria bacterium]